MRTVALTDIAAALRSAGLLRESSGQLPAAITNVTDNSHAVLPDTLFIAVKGTAQDGHRYLGAAERAGASAVVVEDASGIALPSLLVSDSRQAAAVVAATFYGQPASELCVVAVTGTNGKTTSVGMLRHLFDGPGSPSASIGTLGVLVGSAGEVFPGGSGLTTPGAIELQRTLRALADSGVRTVAIEASSHALDQRRVDAIEFAAGLFTNLTRDHLDYHMTMASYFAAKARLISLLGPNAPAIVNADDHAWAELPPASRRITFGLAPDADVRSSDAHFTLHGCEWTLTAHGHTHRVVLPLVGDFNIVNALGAAATAIALGIDAKRVVERLATMPQVPGRLERLSDQPVVLRDYAHTPDALERAIQAVSSFAKRGRVIVVFGCGGDRDAGKRPLMGAIAERLAAHTIITSDNPRTEDPEKILDGIEAGMTRRTHDRIEDRRAAIARALEIADGAHDIVLLAGKGHETYQIRGTEKLPFDEALIVRALLAERR